MNPTRTPSGLLLMVALALALAGCDLAAVNPSEQIANRETILAGTPSATPTPTITNTPTATTTPTSTVGPSPTPTDTPPPTATPLPPTPTANPATAGFSFCDQRAGAPAGRFSATLGQVAASGLPAFEQLVLPFELAPGSAPLSAEASCLSADAFAAGGDPSPYTYTLRLDLPGWLRDERFSSSPITRPLAFESARTILGATWVANPEAPAGASLLIGLREPLPFRITVERNPARIVLAVARASTLVSSSDLLRVPAGGGAPEPAAPLLMLYDGDIWRVAGDLRGADSGLSAGAAGAENLTSSPDTETAFAVSPDGSQVAFCRAAPGLDPADSGLAVPGALWLMGADGSDPRPLAQAGVSCADPAFSLAGDTVAFAVDETGALPTQYTIYTVPTRGGQPRRLIEGGDEWSRFAPQWLAGDALVYAAASQDGRGTLFLRQPSGEVLDLGATILVDEQFSARYSAIGRPLAARDGSRFAVEALRAESPGADTLVLDADGDIVEILGAQRVIPAPPTPTPTLTPTATRTPRPTSTPATPVATGTATAAATAGTPTATATTAPTPEPEPEPEPTREGPYWTRPLAWDEQGRLLYLRTLCASSIVQDYQLYSWAGPQRSDLLGTGQGLGAVGAAASVGGGLAYVLVEQPGAEPRGPAPAAPRSGATLWLWDLASGARGPLITSERGIGALSR